LAQPTHWLSFDPMANKYPGWSPYNYASNNPILFIEVNGDTVSIITSGPTYKNTQNAISTPYSLVGHTIMLKLESYF
jgi:hypothetical protein